MRGLLAVLAAASAVPAPVRAQVSATERHDVVKPIDAILEVGLSSHTYDAGISPWRGVSIGSTFSTGSRSQWRLDAVVEERFAEPSFAYRVQYATDRGAWFVRTAAHTSTGGFYNARYRADAQFGAKLLADRSLLFIGGAFHRAGRDGHRDTGITGEIQYYVNGSWIVQGGIRLLNSTPGSIRSAYYDAAVTWGRQGTRYLTMNVFGGREAYEVIDPLTIYVDFASRGARLSWREWTGRSAGFTAAASWYDNPYYRRIGFEAGFFVRLGS